MAFFNFGGMEGGPSARRQNVDNSKFYSLLGVEKDASDADIKKAFRKQAMTHHPDKGGDPEKFKEISKAYEILSDKEKRQIYDEHGEEGLEQGGGGGGGMDIFEMFGGGMFGGGGRSGGRQRQKRGEDVVFPLKVTLEDLYVGTSKKLRLTKNVICTGCAGKGGKTEATCKDCKGQGVRIVIRQLGPGMIQQMQTACSTCKGTGSQIAEKDKCKVCKAEKTVKEKKTLEVFVTRGMKNGERITFSGEADEAPDTVPGDVVVVLQAAEHPTFKRDGVNLFVKKSITLVEALTGFQFSITHLDGRSLLVKSAPGAIVKPGDLKRIDNEGFPQAKNQFLKGDMYVEFDVKFPEPGTLSEPAKKQLLSILPGPSKSDGNVGGKEGVAMDTSTSASHEEVVLHDVDIEQERRKFESQRKEEYAADEEDDERGHRHGQQAGCRSQ